MSETERGSFGMPLTEQARARAAQYPQTSQGAGAGMAAPKSFNEPRDRGSLEGEIDSYANLNDRLSRLLQLLAERLQPVHRGISDAARSDKAYPSASSSFANALRSQNVRHLELLDALELITAGIDL